MRNITKGFDILIILIVYDNKTYYDVVNDVRKAININKHMILYEYNKVNIIIIFIIFLKINDIQTVYDFVIHVCIWKVLLLKYKSYVINN